MEIKENFEQSNDKAFINALTQKFIYVCYVDLERRIVIRIKAGDKPRRLLEKYSQDHDIELPKDGEHISLDKISLSDVLLSVLAEEEKERAEEELNAEQIEKDIEQYGEFIFEFKAIVGEGVSEYYSLSIVKDEGYDKGRIISFINIDQTQRLRARTANVKNRELMDEINALSSDYMAILTANLDSDQAVSKYIGNKIERELEDFNQDKVYQEPYSIRMKNMAETLVMPEDRLYFLEKTKAEIVKAGLEKQPVYSVLFRVQDMSNNILHMVIKFAKSPLIDNYVVIGIQNLEDEYQERTKKEKAERERRRVIELLAGDFVCVDYVAFTEHSENDKVVSYRRNDEIEEIIPGWNNETNMKNRLNLAAEYAVYAPDKARFIEETRRAKVKDVLEKEGVCFVNFRMMVKKKIKYYQIKFTADIDTNTGKIRGYILGLHSTDEEMRQELKREAELQEATANAERTILARTSELKERNLELSRMNDEVVELLGDVIELRDEESGEHVRRVKGFTRLIAKQMSEMFPHLGITSDDVDYISSAAALHDVGKILISDSILLKPGKLTDEEFALMKQHTVKGCEVLEMAPKSWNPRFVKICKDICRSHHEKWDGRGYPDGLKGEEIPLSAQIVSIADCFDALTSKRVYKDAFPAEKAFDMIMGGECGQFSDEMKETLKQCKERLIAATQDIESLFNENNISVYGMNKLKGTRVLLVDDDELSLDINTDILESEGADVVTAVNGVDAIDKFEHNGPFDVIIIDVIMPVMDGIEASRRIREMEVGQSSEVPIIGLTAEGSSSNTLALMNAGVDACMAKPLVVGELTRILLSGIRERVETMEKVLEDTIRIANTDALTKVKNVTAYSDMISDLTEDIRDGNQPEFAVVVCDINNLKDINDNFGHDVGDQYIKNCCNLICEVFDHSPVYRTGGDEFAVILQGRDYANAEENMVKLKEKVLAAQAIADVESGHASVAAGVAVYDPDMDFTVAEVVKRADSEMYKDKRAMKGMLR